MKDKRTLGQYFTVGNPFELTPFKQWFNSIPNLDNEIILEPFAGSNNIPRLLNIGNQFACFDIDVSYENTYPKFEIVANDSIKNYPLGFNVVVTNPPYLGKSSASRLNLTYEYPEYDDLYKKCLEVMLQNSKYIAAIIPESFITAKIFTERLVTVISLPCKLFTDTDCPVCLALFSPEESLDFSIYSLNTFIGTYSKLRDFIPCSSLNLDLKFNNPEGELGIKCVDSTSSPDIQFVEGNTIPSASIKVSSRSSTRVKCDFGITPEFIKACNDILNTFRENTYDVFMTSFKGLRKDGMYRRRLDFDMARRIINMAYERLYR